MKRWFHAIGGHGPDWFLAIEVRPEDAARLKALVRALSLPGFRRHEARATPGQISAQVGDHDWYLDEHAFPRFVANVTGGPPTNLYVYHSIAIEAHALRIERAYGGNDGAGPAERADSEDRVLAAVLEDPGLEVVRWSVFAGGSGYDTVWIAKGEGRESLRAYLS